MLHVMYFITFDICFCDPRVIVLLFILVVIINVNIHFTVILLSLVLTADVPSEKNVMNKNEDKKVIDWKCRKRARNFNYKIINKRQP